MAVPVRSFPKGFRVVDSLGPAGPPLLIPGTRIHATLDRANNLFRWWEEGRRGCISPPCSSRGDESLWNSVARVLFLEFSRRVLLVPDKGEKRDDCPTRLSLLASTELRVWRREKMRGGFRYFLWNFPMDKIGYGKMMLSMFGISCADRRNRIFVIFIIYQ